MDFFKKILKIGLFTYLIYIFFFSIFIFSFHKATSKKDIADELSELLPNDRTNDRVALVESSEDAISVRLSLIENAETNIKLSYYKLTDGKVADLILGSLLDAADRGVKVQILLDGLIQLGNIGGKVDDIFLGFKSHPNIDLKLYEPFNPLLPLSWNNRLHDKMIIVDNKFALVGGRNIEDRFYLKDIYGDEFVKDRDILIYHHTDDKTSSASISSSVIDDMQSYYDELWKHKYSKPKHKYISNRKIKKGNLSMDNLRSQHKDLKKEFLQTYFKDIKTIDWTQVTLATNEIRFVSNPIGRTNQDPKCLKAILQLSSEAKDNIFIQSPYFIPSRSIKSLFRQYKIDLEKSTILTNSKASSPNILSIAAFKNHKKNMVDNGINIYEYQGPGSIHGKTSIFDQQISVIGTFNIDPRSSYINTESIVIIDSKDFTETLKKEMQNNLFYSLEVGDDYSYVPNKDLPQYQVTKIKKVMISILSKITPFIEYLL